MSKFRKRPIVIEAEQFTGEPDANLESWLGDWFVSWAPKRRQLVIKTRESNEFTADAGDWVICGVAHEFYACKDEIFRATYDPVDDEAPYEAVL